MFKKLLFFVIACLSSFFAYTDENDGYTLIDNWKCVVTKGEKKVYSYIDDKESSTKIFDLKDEYYFISFYEKENKMIMASVYNDYLIPISSRNDNNFKFDVMSDCSGLGDSTIRTIGKIEHVFISNSEFIEISNTDYKWCESGKYATQFYSEATCKQVK